MAAVVALMLSLLISLGAVSPAWAARNTDSYDGNIFALYAGNGALVPPRMTLADALKGERPVLLAFYLDDSAASKAFAPLLSDLQGRWGRAVELIALASDSYSADPSAPADDPSHYWTGVVPQLLVIDGEGVVRFDGQGLIDEQAVEEALAAATGLPAAGDGSRRRTQSFNEYNSEVVS